MKQSNSFEEAVNSVLSERKIVKEKPKKRKVVKESTAGLGTKTQNAGTTTMTRQGQNPPYSLKTDRIKRSV